MNPWEMLEEFPLQIRSAKVESLNMEGYRGIVFSGMGGSGIVGDLAKTLLEKHDTPIPALSLRGYTLPPYVKEGWLVFCISYSGNTEETLSIAQSALERSIKPICISSGGKLMELALKENLPHFSLPEGYPPRYALGYMLSIVLSLLGVKDPLESCSSFLKEKKEAIKEEAKKIAQSFEGYVPVVYATQTLESVAFRWKTQINENAKTLCYTAVLPELHHNEVVGLDNPITRNVCSFLLMFDPEEHPRVIKRVQITEEILRDFGVVPKVIKGEGESFLHRILYLVHLGDWVSLYLSELYKYDPLPVKTIDLIKSKLSV
ncbi:bifunctional phosphoglucose/phosphomannose isomerase [Hydrogenobacter hydrogenophilus]|uniref:Bifunctional phosphoglucose/phosphomannose isomerase n=1 Tax=Hydrogenobacter hydrogenophilus TaxID=35835 RepID=A0A285P0Q8_9AQUI|nr:bifunctional phosphoglucose/phosphomannose isomerase [Hydrogenobacter hydrogenophilus]SNZ15309.1 bifunctional phosphoglucose/phosphomannose isomerase [Hydrogenobacter hydrogenophilus]